MKEWTNRTERELDYAEEQIVNNCYKAKSYQPNYEWCKETLNKNTEQEQVTEWLHF